jgi:hypothetical protein
VTSLSAATSSSSSSCRPCPLGAICKGHLTTLATMKIRKGYWRASQESSAVVRCQGGGRACAGGKSDESSVDDDDNEPLSTDYCHGAARGPWCAT